MMSRSSNSLLCLPPESVEQLQQLGLRLRARRLAQGMTVEQAAERLLCSPTTYRGLETGRPSVSLGLLVHALWLFGVPEGLEQVCPLDIGMILDKRAKRARTANRGIRDDERDF
jgi:transcriptional regulator with XRE-family HTH domain